MASSSQNDNLANAPVLSDEALSMAGDSQLCVAGEEIEEESGSRHLYSIFNIGAHLFSTIKIPVLLNSKETTIRRL